MISIFIYLLTSVPTNSVSLHTARKMFIYLLTYLIWFGLTELPSWRSEPEVAGHPYCGRCVNDVRVRRFAVVQLIRLARNAIPTAHKTRGEPSLPSL